MANKTKGEYITPFDYECLVVEKAEIISEEIVRVKLRSEEYSIETGKATFAPRVSLHYFCKLPLVPMPGTYVRIYLEKIGRDGIALEEE